MRKYLTLTNLPAIISLLALLISLPATVLLIQQKQVFIGKAAEEATLALISPKTVSPGQTFVVEIKLDTGNRTIPTTGTDVILGYATYASPSAEAVIKPLKIIPGNTYDTYPIQEIDIENKKIKISGSASDLSKYFAGSGTFASIEFQAVRTGSVNLSFVWREGATDDTNVVGLVNSQPQERLTSQPAIFYIDIIEQTLSWVNIHTSCQVNNILSGNICDFSALAYTANNQPIWSGVRYEWGISSNNSIGTLSQIYGNMTQFKAQNPGEGDIYVLAKQGDHMEAAGRHLTVLSRPPITPSPSPYPSPSPPPVCQPEKLNVPFNKGTSGATTENYYKGCFTIGVTGVGQASGKEYSDAFYVYTDSQGNPLPSPIHYTYKYNWTLWINGRSAEFLIPNNEIPPYNSNHTYNFTVCPPEGGKLTFGVGDLYVLDNTGSYIIYTCGPIPTPTPTPTPSPPPSPTPTASPIACVPEGQTMPVYPGYRCCEGLTAISTAKPDGNGNCPIQPPLGASVCTKCGNNICGPGENKCNCPKDCLEPKPTFLNFSLFLEGRGSTGFATDVTIYVSYTADGIHAFGPLGKTQTDIIGSGVLTLGEEHIGKTYELFARTSSHLRKKAMLPITIQKGNNYVDFANLIPGDLFIAPGGLNEQDNLVNNFDVAELFQNWGPTGSPIPPAPADLNGDGVVNTWDLKIVFDNFGRSGDNP